MRLVQLINNIKVSSKSIFKILSYILYLQNTFEKYVYLVTSRYLKKISCTTLEAERPGLEPATSRLQVRRPNHYATTPQ